MHFFNIHNNLFFGETNVLHTAPFSSSKYINLKSELFFFFNNDNKNDLFENRNYRPFFYEPYIN